MPRILAALILVMLITACSQSPERPTGYAYQMDPALAPAPNLTVVVASISYGKPSRRLLSRSEPWARSKVEAYLHDKGLTVVPTARFTRSWTRATQSLGEPYDANTGKLNESLFNQVLRQATQELKKSSGIDLVVFADIHQQSVLVGGSTGNRVARWHGVSRAATLIGSGQPSRETYDWNQAFDATSLYITVTNDNADVVFKSAGGLELLEGANLRERKKERLSNVLRDTSALQEAIKLAFHPWIPMKDYPGMAATPAAK